MQTRFKATNAQNLDAVLELVCSIVIKEPFYLNKNVFVKKKKKAKTARKIIINRTSVILLHVQTLSLRGGTEEV